MIKLIVFDFDGVIITGSNQGYFNCYHKALESVGIKLNPEKERSRILERWGQHHRREIELLLKEHPDKVDDAVKVYDENFSNTVYGDTIHLIEGAKETLEGLSKKYILTISSGTERDSLERLIKKFDIVYFKKIISGYDLKGHKQQKPSPFSIDIIAEEFKIPKGEIVCVGDGMTDVLMAQNAGVIPIVVLSGHLNEEEARSLGVKYIIPSIKELPKTLRLISK